MFTIVISEKGGAERRESFDKNEINVGRVQGNDLVLPKGNVSKHHARLLFRDARFIVTDLKSTNGTYVNGRKITQATIVREGDKIYIGDFVVRLDTGSGAQAFPSDEPSYRTEDSGDGQPPAKLPVPREPAPGQPVPQQQAFGQANGTAAAGSTLAPGKAEERAVSHYPLERDPDDSDNAPTGHTPPVKVPAPPRLPGGATLPLGSLEKPVDPPRVPRSPSLPGERPQLRQTGGAAGNRGVAAAAAITGGAPPSVQRPVPSSAATSRSPNVQQAAGPKASRRHATRVLSDRVVGSLGAGRILIDDVLDEALRAEVDKSVRDHAKRMRDGGEFPDGVEADIVARDVLAELSGIGPLESLLDDPDVLEVSASGVDFVQVLRTQGGARADHTFSSNEALDRAIRRIAVRASAPVLDGEITISRALSGGGKMSAVVSSGASPGLLTIRRPFKCEATFEELVQKGAVSRPIVAFLEQVLEGGGRILVVGGRGNGAALLASAFARSTEASGAALIVEGDSDIGMRAGGARVLSLVGDETRDIALLSVVAKLSADPVIVAGLPISLAPAIAAAALDSSAGFLVTVRANSLRQGLSRLACSVADYTPGSTMSFGHETMAAVFDIVVEIAELADSRWRVVRVAELGDTEPGGASVRDIFTAGVDASGVDSGFVATGVTPKIVSEFALRGVRIDSGIFRRGR